jgi:hypothetical protein
LAARLSKQGIHEQSSAHANAAVDAPHGELDSRLFQGFLPCQNVLVDVVDQRAVQVE